MAGTSATLPTKETDIKVLKETLLSQQQLLQKLYAELNVERESSATAANEALSMILRLQTEMAALEMESSQYKRLAEQKIGHAEESLAILEELVYPKEMEISSLGFQIQAYRYKLLSIGYNDLDDFERNDKFNGEINLAPVQDSCSRRDSVRSAAGDFNSYLEQIRILDEKVKEISSTSSLNECHKIKFHGDSFERPNSSSARSASVVHDVYEVPEARAKGKVCFEGEKCNGKSILESDDRLTKPDLILEDSLGLPAEKDEIDWINMDNFLSGKGEKTSCNKLLSLNHEKKLCNSIDQTTDHQSELKQLSQRVEQLESGRNNARHEEEQNLLKDLRDQLNLMQSEMRSWSRKEKPPSPSDEGNLVPLTEAMLYSWL